MHPIPTNVFLNTSNERKSSEYNDQDEACHLQMVKQWKMVAERVFT